jgi:hypothetical protein
VHLRDENPRVRAGAKASVLKSVDSLKEETVSSLKACLPRQGGLREVIKLIISFSRSCQLNFLRFFIPLPHLSIH